jgi:hypothetical protein
LTKAEDVRRYGLNRMKALAELPPEEQRRQLRQFETAAS